MGSDTEAIVGFWFVGHFPSKINLNIQKLFLEAHVIKRKQGGGIPSYKVNFQTNN